MSRHLKYLRSLNIINMRHRHCEAEQSPASFRQPTALPGLPRGARGSLGYSLNDSPTLRSRRKQHIIDAPTENHSVASKEQSIPWGLKDVEAVVEVAAQHFVGDDRKWSFLAVTEAVKAGVRLAAFPESGYKMLLQGEEAVNEG